MESQLGHPTEESNNGATPLTIPIDNAINNALEDNEDLISHNHPTHSRASLLKERKKTLYAFFLLVFSLFVNSCSIALTHQKVPDREKYPPLPDFILDRVTKHRWLNDVADVLVIISVWSCVFLILFHQYR